MNRRAYLVTTASLAAGATTGCVSALSNSDPSEVVLPAPEDKLTDSADLAYPAYGEEFPAVTLPDPVAETTVHTGEFDRITVATAFFASCPAECGILLNQLAGVQGMVADRGLTDEVVFAAITFDPQRDDAAALRSNAERVGADLSAGNWHYLRPESPEEANEIVAEKLGVRFERTTESDRLSGYDFTHIVVTWLVNPDGVVERSYRGENLDRTRVIEDIEALQENYTADSA